MSVSKFLTQRSETFSEQMASNLPRSENEPLLGTTFLKAHWDSIASIDFTTVEVWTRHGLTTFYVLIVMELKTRRIAIAGVTENPCGNWIKQIARNLTGWGGFLANTSYILIDRDTKFQPFREYLSDLTDIKVVLLPPRSPNLNAHIERFMRSLKSECLNLMIIFGRPSLERSLKVSRSSSLTIMPAEITKGSGIGSSNRETKSVEAKARSCAANALEDC